MELKRPNVAEWFWSSSKYDNIQKEILIFYFIFQKNWRLRQESNVGRRGRTSQENDQGEGGRHPGLHSIKLFTIVFFNLQVKH